MFFLQKVHSYLELFTYMYLIRLFFWSTFSLVDKLVVIYSPIGTDETSSVFLRESV